MILEKKVALVTGASRGVGAAIARVFAAQGASVCVNFFQSPEKAEAVVADIRAAGGTAFAFGADINDVDAVHSMVETTVKRFGRLDIVVNNALPDYKFDPSAPYTHIESVAWEHFSSQIGAIHGAVNTTKAALPTMKAQHFGKIINISSNLVYNPVVTYYDYTTAKAGLVGLTRNLATELGPFGIRVNLLAGGLLRTTDASAVTTPEVFEYVRAGTPLRQTITPEEFAQAALLFASDWSNAITGQSVSVDGGLTMP